MQNRTASSEIYVSVVVPDQGSFPAIASLYYSSGDPYTILMAFHVGTDDPV